MMDHPKRQAGEKSTTSPILLLLIAATTVTSIWSRIALSDLPGQFSNGEMPESVWSCLAEKKQIELCDPRQMEHDPTKSSKGLLAHFHSTIDSQLNELREEGLKNDVNFDIPLKTSSAWYATVGTRIQGSELSPHEISSDPARSKENDDLTAKSPGKWLRLSFQLGPRIPFGFKPREIANKNTQNYAVEGVPQIEFNYYETRWHPLDRNYNENNFIDGLKEDAQFAKNAPKDVALSAKSMITATPDELGRDFLPGEVLEIERYGAASLDASPAVDVAKMGASLPMGLGFGAVVTAGFTTERVFHYYRCAVEKIDDDKSRVTFTRLIGVPEPWWQRAFGQNFGFVVGAGPLILTKFFNISWLMPKWEPIAWTKYGVETDVFDVDRSLPGVDATPEELKALDSRIAIDGDGKKPSSKTPKGKNQKITPALALTLAYKKGQPADLFRIAKASESDPSGNLGVVRLEHDVRFSTRTSPNELNLVLWAKSQPHYTSDFTRTRFHESPAQTTDKVSSIRALTDEYLTTGKGIEASHAIDVAVRTAANPDRKASPLAIADQKQSLRLTYNFSGHYATRDEMIEFLTAAQVFTTCAIDGNPDPKSSALAEQSLAAITSELARVKQLAPDDHSKVSAYYYFDLDPTALESLLSGNRSAEFLRQWLKAYNSGITVPADCAGTDATGCYQTLDDIARQSSDRGMRGHLKTAWKVLSAAADAQQFSNDRAGRADMFLQALKKLDLDLYPFAAMARMDGAPAHTFIVSHLKSRLHGDKTETKISFGSVGNQFEMPITMLPSGRAN